MGIDKEGRLNFYSLLLGHKRYLLLEDLQDPGPFPDTGDAYKITIRKLDFGEYVLHERPVFRQLTPGERETADQFMVRLRKQARHCYHLRNRRYFFQIFHARASATRAWSTRRVRRGKARVSRSTHVCLALAFARQKNAKK